MRKKRDKRVQQGGDVKSVVKGTIDGRESGTLGLCWFESQSADRRFSEGNAKEDVDILHSFIFTAHNTTKGSVYYDDIFIAVESDCQPRPSE